MCEGGSGAARERVAATSPTPCACDSSGSRSTTTRRGWAGTTPAGNGVAWNLVSGLNDPPRNSERVVWVDGRPTEPGPVSFRGLEAVDSEDGRLSFEPEGRRSHRENRLLIRSSYEAPFGSFHGTLPGGIDVGEGLGVMECHEATW